MPYAGKAYTIAKALILAYEYWKTYLLRVVQGTKFMILLGIVPLQAAQKQAAQPVVVRKYYRVTILIMYVLLYYRFAWNVYIEWHYCAVSLINLLAVIIKTAYT